MAEALDLLQFVPVPLPSWQPLLPFVVQKRDWASVGVRNWGYDWGLPVGPFMGEAGAFAESQRNPLVDAQLVSLSGVGCNEPEVCLVSCNGNVQRYNCLWALSLGAAFGSTDALDDYIHQIGGQSIGAPGLVHHTPCIQGAVVEAVA